MVLYHLQIKVPNEYLSFFQILYNLLLFLFLFHITSYFISNRPLFIHAFQGKLLNHSFGILLSVIFLVCFSYFIITEQIFQLEFIGERETFIL